MPDLLESPHLKLPYLAAAQAQKHVTHNEALKRLDSIVQLAVLDAGLDAPPGTPADGDRYIVAADATGDWEEHDGEVATFVDGAWDFAAPEAGWLAYDVAGEMLLVHADGGWHSIAGYFGAVDKFGVNATPDDTNRLAVRSAAVLFSGIEAGDGGTGDIRFIIDKEADGDTASLLFQSGWSGRAEVGLAGDTDFVFKVSADGSSWIEAIRIDKDTGLAAILYDNSVSGLAATSVQDAIDEVAAAGGGGGAVASVFGRSGTVAAASGDYDASQVDNDSSVSGASVKDALDTLGTGVAAKQAADSDLTALAGVSATGLLARTGSGTAAARTITGPAAGIGVSNGDGVSGNPTLALANDLASLEAMSGTGLLARTASETYAQRTLTAPAAGITVSNGDGISGNPTLALADDLSALEAMSGTGVVARTASNTYAQRTIAAGAGISVSNGDGVSGNPTIAGSAATTAAYGDVKLGTEVREKLAANRTWYVRTDGSDSNTGLVNNAGGAFLTIQKALSTAAALDIGTFDATVQVADGTYTAGGIVTGPWLGSGTVTVVGNTTTPANVIVSTTGADCFLVRTGGRLTVSGMELRTTTAGSGLHATTGAAITIGSSIRFGANANFQIYAETNGAVVAAANYSIVGSGLTHYQALSAGVIQCIGITVTLSGTLSFTVFASAERSGIIEAYSNTYTGGTITGTRYAAGGLSYIFTNGGGASYFPGSIAGTGTNPGASPYGLYA